MQCMYVDVQESEFGANPLTAATTVCVFFIILPIKATGGMDPVLKEGGGCLYVFIN